MADAPDLGGVGEFARLLTVRYPIPFAVAVNIAFCFGCLYLARGVAGALQWVLVGFAIAAFLIGNGLFIYAMMRNPALLRSERYQSFDRVLKIVGDSDSRSDVITLGHAMLDEGRPKNDPHARGGISKGEPRDAT